MKIQKIILKNYKSIKDLEIQPDEGLNAFIGENSVGKSNIFDAINWLIGPVYPSFNSTTKQDHWQGNLENKIQIRLYYNDTNYLELAESWFDQRGNEKSGLNLSGNYINAEKRDDYCSAYLGNDREIKDYLPSNRWSLIGRILQQINNQFLSEKISCNGEIIEKKNILKGKLEEIRDNILFSVGRKNNSVKDGLMDKFMRILQEESAKQLNREENTFSIDLSLYDPWNFYRTLQLLVNEPDMDMQFQASSLGMGVQASITIAILKAYAELNLANKTPIFIDEPELFLHPQAQIYFYRLLKEMCENMYDENGKMIREGIQIFYTTHSPNFIQSDKFNELFLVRKTKEKGTFCTNIKVDKFITDFKMRTGCDTTIGDITLRFKNAYENTGDSRRANEAFFAKKIILVEGQSESLVIPYLFQIAAFDYVKESISIVRCGCKSEIDRFFRLYNAFGIPCFIIFDGDIQNQGTKAEETCKIQNREILSLFGITIDWPDGRVHDRFLGFQKRFDDELGFHTSKKGLDLYVEVKKQIITTDNLPWWVSAVIEKIKLLENNLAGVLKISNSEPPEDLFEDDLPF